MNESIDTYLQILKHLSKDCNFTAVTAEQHRQSYIRDAFINGLYSKEIWNGLYSKTFRKHDINVGSSFWTSKIPQNVIQKFLNIQPVISK